MKILVTCLSESWGGMEMFALQTAQQLIKRNIETEILAFTGSRLHLEAEKEKIIIHTSSFKNYFSPKEIFKAGKLFRSKKYDVVHCGASKDLWLLVPALKFFGIDAPLLLSKQMGSYIVKKDFLHKWIYNRVNYALAISNVISKNLVDTTPLTSDKVLLLHNAIDTNYFDPAKISGEPVRKEFNINDDEIAIGMMARFSPGKGHEEFLRSAKFLLEHHAKLKFLIVGEPSKGENNYAAEIKTLAANLGIIDKIIFTGFRKDTPNILAALDIFVFPSHAEAFGIALAEALSMGKPSVCSNSDGVLDIAVDGVTSYLFEKQNWEDLSQKIERLTLSPETRKDFGIAARKRAVEMFDLEIFTDKLIKIYERVVT